MKKVLTVAVYLHAFFLSSPMADTSANSIYISFGFDYSLATLTCGYSRTLDIESADRDLDLFMDFTVPPAEADLGEFRLRAGGDMELFHIGEFSVPLHTALVDRGFKNSLVTGFGFGSEWGIRPGFYEEKFALAGEII